MFIKNFGTNNFPHMSKKILILPVAIACTMASTANAGEWSANASMTNNYIWRGLTQSENEAAVQGGIDYAGDSGFYMGTWASNVNYGGGDTFSYEHDIYAGYAFDAGGVSWDGFGVRRRGQRLAAGTANRCRQRPWVSCWLICCWMPN